MNRIGKTEEEVAAANAMGGDQALPVKGDAGRAITRIAVHGWGYQRPVLALVANNVEGERLLDKMAVEIVPEYIGLYSWKAHSAGVSVSLFGTAVAEIDVPTERRDIGGERYHYAWTITESDRKAVGLPFRNSGNDQYSPEFLEPCSWHCRGAR
jgi:hypothetical protein